MLTPDQINRAWKLRAGNQSYQQIGEAIGCSAKTVRTSLYPNHPAQRKRPIYSKPFPNGHKVIKQSEKVVPKTVLEQRERDYEIRMSAHLTTGQLLLGDPMPGRSALDQRKVHNR